MEETRKHELLVSLVDELSQERGADEPVPAVSDAGLWRLFRALVNTRQPQPASKRFLAAQDELLQGLIAEAGIHTIDDTTPSPTDSRLLLWQGDITTLAVDAIVNAANSQMLGCWVPGHDCIDNAIHTFAGVQLRLECARLMADQGHDEPTGTAKVTSAWNLPAKRVIHTVGPVANGAPNDIHRAQLSQCYTSCLDAAASEGLHTVAFCSISTGAFGFPGQEAAEIAVRSVRTWLGAHRGADIRVIFDVFTDDDLTYYRRLLAIR